MQFVKSKAMWPEVVTQKWINKKEMNMRVRSFICAQPPQHDETITFSSNVWYLCAAGVLLTNDREAAFAAQRAILEPFRETLGVHSPLLPIRSAFQLPR